MDQVGRASIQRAWLAGHTQRYRRRMSHGVYGTPYGLMAGCRDRLNEEREGVDPPLWGRGASWLDQNNKAPRSSNGTPCPPPSSCLSVFCYVCMHCTVLPLLCRDSTMLPFSTLILRSYYQAIGWNEDNSYSQLTRSSSGKSDPTCLLDLLSAKCS